MHKDEPSRSRRFATLFFTDEEGFLVAMEKKDKLSIKDKLADIKVTAVPEPKQWPADGMVYVGNLTENTTEDEIREYFASFGIK